jgi:NAD(P)-dependent dehydrogenase (short-subunit alcohol dehydrogenase family)
MVVGLITDIPTCAELVSRMVAEGEELIPASAPWWQPDGNRGGVAMTEAGVDYRLDGRVVIVTGASAGIGRWLASGLDAAGARLVLAARRAEALKELADGLADAIVVPGDIASDEDRERLVAAAVDRYGQVDGLVNNAGIAHFGPALNETAADVRHQLEINVVGPFDLARRCVQQMRGTGGGSIVNITSMSAIVATGATMPSAGYCASKAAFAHMTRELAVQWGRYDVRVNAVAPGMFPTEMTLQMEEVPDFFASRLIIKRVGRAHEIVAAVQFLLSDASSYTTGQQIVVDGGRTVT